jgi:hypothetical protein
MTDLDEGTAFAAPGEDDDRLIAIENSHLFRGRCACGADALAAEGRTPRCGTCLLNDAATAVEPPRPAIGVGSANPFRLGQGRPPVRSSGRAPYPAPEVTSRDEPDWNGDGAPSAFLKNAEKVRAAGWRVKVQRSRGCPPNGATGAPGAARDLFALIASRQDGAASCYAVYAGTGWASVMLWGRAATWFPSGSISDLAEYVAAGGVMPAEWYAAIRNRAADSETSRKERESCNRGVHAMKYRSQTDGVMSCARCSNSWLAAGEPWKRPKVRKTEAN